MSQRVGIVLFNLGGPDTLDAVKPFLRNLFSDKAIIRAPSFVRWPLARLKPFDNIVDIPVHCSGDIAT